MPVSLVPISMLLDIRSQLTPESYRRALAVTDTMSDAQFFEVSQKWANGEDIVIGFVIGHTEHHVDGEHILIRSRLGRTVMPASLYFTHAQHSQSILSEIRHSWHNARHMRKLVKSDEEAAMLEERICFLEKDMDEVELYQLSEYTTTAPGCLHADYHINANVAETYGFRQPETGD